MLNQYNAIFIITDIKLFIYIWHVCTPFSIAPDYSTFSPVSLIGSCEGNSYKSEC